VGKPRPILARDLAGTVAYAGVDPTVQGRAVQMATAKRLTRAATNALGLSSLVGES
jgi:hypothetical protein